MDRNHRLDAPNNDSLQDIEQVADRSGLSTLYFNAHKEWEGKELLTDEQREAKQTKEQLDILIAIRKQSPLVALLVPTPIVLFIIMLAAAAAYLTPENMRFTMPLALLAVATWGIISFFAVRKAYAIFYKHALQATPFILILVAMLGLSTQVSYLLTEPFHTDTLILNVMIVSAGTYLASIILSTFLLFVWTSPRIKGTAKIGLLLLAVALLIASIFLLIFL